MGVTREDRIRRGRWLEVSDEEWARQLESVNQALSGYLCNDEWAPKIKKNVGVLLTASSYGRAYLKGALETHQRLGFWVAVAYDNFIDPKQPAPIDWNYWMPPKDCMDLMDTFLMPHHQGWGGVSYPYIWQLRLASGLMSGFEYVFCNNGDCIIEKPEGFQQLIDRMGDADIMSAGPTLPREIGTASFLVRGKVFQAIAKHMNDHMVPFEEYEKSTQEFGNTEGRLAVAVRDLGLKAVVVPTGKCPHHDQCEQFHEPGHGLWYDAIGFRHIHGEHNYAYRYKGTPPHYRYLDQRFMGDEYNQIKKYHDLLESAKGIDDADEVVNIHNQARAILEGWWAKD